jgi:hypothetical protein
MWRGIASESAVERYGGGVELRATHTLHKKRRKLAPTTADSPPLPDPAGASGANLVHQSACPSKEANYSLHFHSPSFRFSWLAPATPPTVVACSDSLPSAQ